MFLNQEHPLPLQRAKREWNMNIQSENYDNGMDR